MCLLQFRLETSSSRMGTLTSEVEVEEDVENGVATGAVEMIAVMEEATEEEETEAMGVGIMAEGAEETTAVTEAEGVASLLEDFGM